MKHLCSIFLLSLVSLPGMTAEAKPSDDKQHWEGEAGLGYLATTGNSQTSTFNGKLDATHEKDVWRNNLTANMFYSSDGELKTAEKYFISGQSNYTYSKHMSLFARGSYEDDRFSGFEYQGTAIVGLGRRFLQETPTMTMDIEGGVGIRGFQEEGSASDSEGIVRVMGKYVWNFREKSRFSQELSSDIGDQFSVSKSITNLTAQLMGNFAINLGYTVKYTSEVPLGKQKTDTETTINLVYVF